MAAIVESSLFQATKLFRYFTDQQVERLAELCIHTSIAPDEDLIRFGERVDSLFIVSEGAVNVSTSDRSSIIAVLKVGESIGEMSLLDPNHIASANVNAGGSGATLITLSQGLLNEKVLDDPDFALPFYKGMCQLLTGRLKSTNQRIQARVAELMEKKSTEKSNTDKTLDQASIDDLLYFWDI